MSSCWYRRARRPHADRQARDPTRAENDLTAAGARSTPPSRAGYCQTLAATKLAADAKRPAAALPEGELQHGCIATVDSSTRCPAVPAVRASLAKGVVVSNLDIRQFAALEVPLRAARLRTYPTHGQVTARREDRREPDAGGGNGNMLILVAPSRAWRATGLRRPYWPVLTRWANTSRQGLRPENQCAPTTSRAPPHNVNLLAKAIVAIGAFAQLARARATGLGAGVIARWPSSRRALCKEAAEGSRFRSRSTSRHLEQKYNSCGPPARPQLVPRVGGSRMAFYRTVQASYGRRSTAVASTRNWTGSRGRPR